LLDARITFCFQISNTSFILCLYKLLSFILNSTYVVFCCKFINWCWRSTSTLFIGYCMVQTPFSLHKNADNWFINTYNSCEFRKINIWTIYGKATYNKSFTRTSLTNNCMLLLSWTITSILICRKLDIWVTSEWC
jgi:hypothetical protein